MNQVSLTGSDTQKINGRLLNDLADADCGVLTFPNDIAKVKKGKNGNTIYSLDQSGLLGDYVVRVLRGSSDDRFFNQLLQGQIQNIAGFVLLTGEFIKKVGDGLGNVTNDEYVQSGGIFTKLPEMKSNQEGDTNQSVVEYHIRFGNNVRIIS